MQRSLACGLAMVAFLAAAPSALAHHSELLARWHLDAVDGGFTPDNSGHDLQGEMNGNSSIVAGGRFANALDLDNSGGDSQVDVPDNATLEPAKITVLAWVKLGTAPAGTTYIVAKGSSACTGASYALSTPSGGLVFRIFNGSTVQTSPNAGTGVWNDQWHAVAGSFDGATVRLYVDGTQVANGSPAATSIAYGLSMDDMRIGNYPASNLCGPGTLVFGGLIDEVRVYNRALDPEEIAFLSNSSSTEPPNLPPPPTNQATPSISSAVPDVHPGDGLTANTGSWTGSPTSYSYQWLRCAADGGGCVEIAGATASTFTVTDDDLGKTLRVRVRATNASGTSGPAESTQTRAVTARPLAARLSVTPNPTCTGVETFFDGSQSSGPAPVVRYRFEYGPSAVRHFSGSTQVERWESIGEGDRVVVVGDGPDPSARRVFSWNRVIVPNPPQFDRIAEALVPGTYEKRLRHYEDRLRNPVYAREDVVLTLTVTDATGAQARVHEVITFKQSSSVQKRSGCPVPLSFKLAPDVRRAASRLRTSASAVSTVVPCGAKVNCVGQLLVSPASVRRSARRRRIPLDSLKRFTVPAGKSKRVQVSLANTAKRTLRERGRLRAKVTVSLASPSGQFVSRSRTVTFRVRGRRR